MQIWQVLKEIQVWERENLPCLRHPEGKEVLLWVLKCRTERLPLKDLYGTSRYSEPTIRRCLKEFISLGLLVLEPSDKDKRESFARPTQRMDELITDYILKMKKCSTSGELYADQSEQMGKKSAI